MKELYCDVAVVAGGPAGLAAAISAAEKGLNVIVFEKANTTGGTANMGMGPFAVESELQKDMMQSLTVESAFEEYMRETRWHVDARLVHSYFEKSADTIRWLEDMGVRFAGVKKYFPGSHCTWHVVQPDGSGVPGPRSAGTMIKRMTERAEELGVKILLETPVKKLLREENYMTGLLAVDKAGEEVRCEAMAVVVATGGFGCSDEMILRYTGYTYGEDILSFRIPGIEGDGLRMAWEVGAGKSRMSMEKIFQLAVGTRDDRFMPLSNIFSQPNLLVNMLGERVMNEELLEHTSYTANVIDIQKDRRVFSILDEGALEHYRKNNVDVPSELTKAFGNPMEYFDRCIDSAVGQHSDLMIRAESVEELAEKIGCPVEALRATIEEYNKICDQGWDPLFGKHRKYLRALRGPVYYAAVYGIGAYGSLGGIKIDHRTQVLTDDYEAIEGLYAAGSDVNDIYDGSYVFTFPGNTMGFALNTGRMAGENAAEYVMRISE